jgi:hypothetical protein
LERNADPNKANDDEWDALHYAELESYSNSEQTQQSLTLSVVQLYI